MEEKNFIEKNKTLLALFCFSSLLLMLIGSLVGKGIFSNIPQNFLVILDKQANGMLYFFYHDVIPVNFSNRLLALPYNILIPLFDKSPFVMINLYAFSCSFATLAATLMNFFFANRTKKSEYAALALMFYAFFAIAAFLYPIDTTYISIPMFFILLQYFFTEEELSKFDYSAVAVISFYMLQSSANMVIPCIILSFTGFIILAKEKLKNNEIKNWKVKLFLAFSSALAAFYMVYKTFFYEDDKSYICPSFEECIFTFKTALISTFDKFLTSDMMFSTIALIFIICALVKNKIPHKKEGIIATFVALFVIYSIYEFTNFHRNPFIAQKYFALTTIALIIVTLVISIINISGKKFGNKEVFCNSIISVACFCGIIQCMIQYGQCIDFGRYTDYIKCKVKENVGVIKIPVEDYKNKSYLVYDSCNSTVLRSLMVSDFEVKSLIVPNQNFYKNDKACIGYNDVSHANDEDNQFIIIQDEYFSGKNYYWKFRDIATLMAKAKLK